MDNAQQDFKKLLEFKQSLCSGNTCPITVQNLNCFTPNGMQILTDIGFKAEVGELVAMMGPSGSGKTTLLNFLGNRPSGNLRFKVESFMCGTQNIKDCFWKKIKFVQQEDFLHGFMTVYGIMDQYVTLNYGIKVSAEERNHLINQALSLTGLHDCKDTPIGDIFRKGISGGQKRRLSVILELIARPQILVLDEPTSGLDSASAFHLMKLLKSLARSLNAIVIMSLHQPSSEIWELIDRLIILSKGKLMYEGPRSKCLEAFESYGNKCPLQYNPADFVISSINNDFNPKLDVQLIAIKFAEWKTKQPQQFVPDLSNYEINSAIVRLDKNLSSINLTSAGFFSHFLSLLWRNFLNNAMNPGIFLVRLGMYVMLSALIGLMYFDLENDTIDDQSINSRVSVFFYVCAFLVFMSIAAMPFFLMERAIFEKEYRNNLYGVVPYCFAQTIASVPGVFVISLISSSIIVSMLQVHGFGIFLLDLTFALLAAEQLAILTATLVPHYIIGMAAISGCYGFFMLCEGFMIVKSKIPDYLIWGYYLAFHSYSFRIFMYNEFDDLGQTKSQRFPTGKEVLDFYDMNDKNIGRDLGILILYWGGFFVLNIVIMLIKYRRKMPKIGEMLKQNNVDEEV